MNMVINKPLPLPENLEFRDVVKKLEECINDMPEKVESSHAPVEHYFCDKLYARQIHMPAGTIVVGKIHAKEHISIISAGVALVASEQGSHEIKAPMTFISLPNTKRVVYVLEDMIWTTLHPNESNTQDLDELEADLITKNYILESII
jgi:hypothetical protein